MGVNEDNAPYGAGDYNMSVTINGVPGSSGGVSGGVRETPSYLMALIGMAAIGALGLRQREA